MNLNYKITNHSLTPLMTFHFSLPKQLAEQTAQSCFPRTWGHPRRFLVTLHHLSCPLHVQLNYVLKVLENNFTKIELSLRFSYAVISPTVVHHVRLFSTLHAWIVSSKLWTTQRAVKSMRSMCCKLSPALYILYIVTHFISRLRYRLKILF